ncbi:MAG: hypothetical protein H7144_04930 [Burkholderiales bacterium]|nr:hypothetical protein [Phycisphaerae bacterium]
MSSLASQVLNLASERRTAAADQYRDIVKGQSSADAEAVEKILDQLGLTADDLDSDCQAWERYNQTLADQANIGDIEALTRAYEQAVEAIHKLRTEYCDKNEELVNAHNSKSIDLQVATMRRTRAHDDLQQISREHPRLQLDVGIDRRLLRPA